MTKTGRYSASYLWMPQKQWETTTHHVEWQWDLSLFVCLPVWSITWNVHWENCIVWTIFLRIQNCSENELIKRTYSFMAFLCEVLVRPPQTTLNISNSQNRVISNLFFISLFCACVCMQVCKHKQSDHRSTLAHQAWQLIPLSIVPSH